MLEKILDELEMRRLLLQKKLDAQKDTPTRNRMGQFATPTALAVDILRYAASHLVKNESVRFLDPAFGTGVFYSELLRVFPRSRIGPAVGYEVDEHYGIPTRQLWNETDLELRLEDFTCADNPENAARFNLLICNPPYVRHHYIASAEKRRLRLRTQHACGVGMNGLAGLYCYFLALSHEWMAENALAGWLIPSEFMDVKYGASVKEYLLDRVTLTHIHRFDPSDVQFDDAHVSSAVVWFRNKPPESGHQVRFTYSGTLNKPKNERWVSLNVLRRDPKWTRYPLGENYESIPGPVLGDFFHIKRGIATGNNSYFILALSDIEKRGLPLGAFKPILPSPRYVHDDVIHGDLEGNPRLEPRLFLLDPPWREDEIEECYPSLWNYLEEGRLEGVSQRYLCRHRGIWYAQEYRPPAPFVCNYLGRNGKRFGKPFRFILNNSQATAANVYLMLYPKDSFQLALADSPKLRQKVWRFLNDISPETLLSEGRVYGGGLYKLEPKELANVRAEAIDQLIPELVRLRNQEQWSLFD